MKNEFNALQQVLMARPTHMKITEVINEVQKQHAETNIDTDVALVQHAHFVTTLQNEGVEVYYLETDEALNEQVFTRDIGFVIDDLFCVANLKEPIRQAEKEKLLSFLKQKGIRYTEFEHPIEGGDVLVHGETIYVGLSNRTSVEAVQELKRKFPYKRIVPIQLKSHILHLDCVFTILNHEVAILHTDGIQNESLEKIEKRFTFLEITKEEQETMASNVLAIGNNKIISLATQKRLNENLKQKGFDVITLDFSEIIKSGGSFRCCTLPLKRAKE